MAPKIYKCSKCKKLGHSKATCTQGLRNCSVCMKTGHDKRNCPHYIQLKCAKCFRSTNEHYEVELREPPSNYKRRKFGAPISDGKVCGLCFNYCRPDVENQTWNSAWPAVIRDVILGKVGNLTPEDIINLIPLCIRSMYKACIPLLTEPLREIWGHESMHFIDRTERVKSFKTRQSEFTLDSFNQSMHTTCLPVARCIQGCWIYPEEDLHEEVDYVPISNWIAYLDPSFKDFGADGKIFKGKKPSWPSIERPITYELAPAVLLDDEHGFVIVTCSKKKHCNGKFDFIHPPENPLGNVSEQTNDQLAPVTISPNIVRCGKSSMYNTSYPVFKEYGSPVGMASFKLDSKPVFQQEVSLEDRKFIGLALDCRTDIRQILSVDGGAFQSRENMNAVLEEFRKNLKPPVDQILKALSCGSFVTKQDAVNMYASCTDIDKKSVPSVLKMRPMVHPANGPGHTLFNVRQYLNDTDMNRLENRCALSIVNILINCRPIYNSMISMKTPTHPLWTRLLNCLPSFQDNKPTVKLTDVGVDILQYMSSANIATEDPQHITACILDNLSSDAHSLTLPESTNKSLKDSVCGIEKSVLIVVAPNKFEPTERIFDRKWTLMYACDWNTNESTNEFIFASRWNETMDWQYCSPSRRISTEIQGKYSLLVYIQAIEVSLNRTTFLNMAGGQSKLRCSKHSAYFMMKEDPKKVKIMCCKDKCFLYSSWRCSHGFGGSSSTMPCRVGLCKKHGKEILFSDHSGLIVPSSATTQRVQNQCSNADSDSDSASEFSCEHDSSGDEIDAEVPDHFFTEYMMEEEEEYDDSIVSTNYSIADFTDGNERIDGHYMINNFVDHRNVSLYLSQSIPIKWHKMLTYIHSIVQDKNLPLLYPEGLLFPKIFWALSNGIPLGSLPSVFYSEISHQKVLKGFATFIDHMRVRLCDHSLLTSTDRNYVAWTFDCYMNRMLARNNGKIAFQKGFEHIMSQGLSVDNSEFTLPYDEIDSRRTVSQLASLMKYYPWAFFITLTCNYSATVGIWPIKAALEEKYGIDTPELKKALQSYCGLFSRAWYKVLKFFFRYLVGSKEDILGDVIFYWVRIEFQDGNAPGNQPHAHAGITLHPNSKYTKTELLEMVHNKLNLIFNRSTRTDYESLLERGFVKDRDDYVQLQKLAHQIFVHNCSNARFKCMRTKADGSSYCRVPNYRPGFEATELIVDSVFPNSFKELLCEVNLATKTDTNGDVKYVLDELLRYSMYNYPKEPGFKSVPTNGQLFALFKSMVNVQVCSPMFQGSYLAKYVSKVTPSKSVHLSKSNGNISVEIDAEKSSKDSGSSRRSQICRKGSSAVRQVTLPEMWWILLQFPYTFTNVKFLNFSTHAPEHRYHLKKQKSNARVCYKSIEDRQGLPVWRQFTNNQVIFAKQFKESKFSVDKTSTFSVRPPELIFVMRVELYLKYFVADYGKYSVSSDLYGSPFVDALGRRMRVRIIYISAVKDLLDELFLSRRDDRVDNMRQFFGWLQTEVAEERRSDKFSLFVDSSQTIEIVPVMTNMDVSVPHVFLIHLLISLGSFVTEHCLYTQDSMYDAFVHAGLLDVSLTNAQNWSSLCERYVREQLIHFPLTSKDFSKKLTQVAHLLEGFINDRSVNYSMPTIMEFLMRDKAEKEVESFILDKRTQLIHCIHQQNVIGIPNLDVMLNNDRFIYDPILHKVDQQSSESFGEQLLALEHLKSSIQKYCSLNTNFVKGSVLMGPPGAGKTYILLIACLYALSMGLTCALTAITGERARMLGGEHLHSIFKFPVDNPSSSTPSTIAASCLAALIRNKIRHAYLKAIDVLVIEEIGLIPNFFFNVIDYVLRSVRKNDKPYGGVLIIATGDHRQLKPIDANSIWVGSELLANFQIIQMTHYVRCRMDADLAKILEIFRKAEPTSDDIQLVRTILLQRCSSNCVESWDAVPYMYFRVVSKNQAARKIIDDYLRLRKQDENNFVSESYDEVQILNGQWVKASSAHSIKMNARLREQSNIVFFDKAIMRLTYNCSRFNNSNVSFNQGQLVVVIGLPDEKAEVTRQYVSAKLVPPGRRIFDVDNLPDSWPVIKLRRRKSFVYKLFFDTKAVREQFPLTYYICNTIHKSIGETIEFLATRVDSKSNAEYSIWERNQGLVLLSRVQSLSNLMFVGDIQVNVEAIQNLLLQRDPLEEYVNTYIGKCDMLYQFDRYIPPQPFTIYTNERIPSGNCGFVYMAISKKKDVYHIDECLNLRKKIVYLNSIFRESTEKYYQPWNILCYLTGFKENGEHYKNVEDRSRFKNILIENLYVDNIQKPKDALDYLLSLYHNLKESEYMSNVCVKQMFSLDAKDKEPDFVPFTLNNAQSNEVESEITPANFSILEKIPTFAELLIEENTIQPTSDTFNNVFSNLHNCENEGTVSKNLGDVIETMPSKRRKLSHRNVNTKNSSKAPIIPNSVNEVDVPAGFHRLPDAHILDSGIFKTIETLLIQTPPDGHCLFHSVVESLDLQMGVQIQLDHLIDSFRSQFQGNLNNYLVAFDLTNENPGKLLEDYLVSKRYNNVIGDIAPLILSDVLKRRIVVLNVENDIQLRIRRHRPLQYNDLAEVYIYRQNDHYQGIRCLQR